MKPTGYRQLAAGYWKRATKVVKGNIAIIENDVSAAATTREKLTRALLERGYSVTILGTGTADRIEQARRKGFRVIDVKGSNQNPLHIFMYLRRLKKALKSTKATICLTFTIRPAIWGNVVTRLLGIPTITNITGIGPLFSRNNVSYRAARMLYKFVLQRTAKVFFQNNDDLKLFVENKFVKPERSERIPGSGIDYRYYTPLKRRDKDNRFIFLFIGRLLKDKGIVEYVEAARMLKSKLPDAEFRVLGSLWFMNVKDNTVQETALRQWTRDGIIRYLGDTEDVRPFIAAADCVVLPSYREGTSNVLLEASSMERPCITCNTTGCKEIVTDGVTGFLCNVRDAADLAGKMEKMHALTEEQRTEMGVRAREKVIREFDKQFVIDAYLKAVEKIKAPK